MYLLSRLHKRPSDIPNAPEESLFIYLSFVQLLMPFHCLYDCQKSIVHGRRFSSWSAICVWIYLPQIPEIPKVIVVSGSSFRSQRRTSMFGRVTASSPCPSQTSLACWPQSWHSIYFLPTSAQVREVTLFITKFLFIETLHCWIYRLRDPLALKNL